jgi:galactose mutarotase-like enzyme
MIYTITSPALTVEVNSIGIELSSIKSNTSDLEYIWQGDPAIWNGQAPVLFPIIGVLKQGVMTYQNQEYRVPKHGLVRYSTQPILKESSENSLLFSFSWDDESLQQYPFKFELEVQFTLTDKTIQVTHRVKNMGNETMLYSVGAHPGFNCPLKEGESYEEYFLQFPEKETDSTWLVENTGLIGLGQKPVLENSSILPLNKHLFDNDALIFKHLKSREVTLCHKEKGAILSVNFHDFDYLGIWAKPGAPFLCIEPWLGIGDSVDSNQNFEEKEGIIKLNSGQIDVKTYTITIEQ